MALVDKQAEIADLIVEFESILEDLKCAEISETDEDFTENIKSAVETHKRAGLELKELLT